MSWNGTVRCGYCHATGHNRRGCAKLTEELKKSYLRSIWVAASWRSGAVTGAHVLYTAERKEQEADYYDQCAETQRKRYLSRTNIDLATGKKVAKEERQSSKKRCSYCRHSGHDRRKCENLANDYKILTYQIKKDRAEAAGILRDEGIAVGSLVIQTRNGYDSDGQWTRNLQTVGLVTAIDLASYINHRRGVDHSRDPYIIRCSSMGELGGKERRPYSTGMTNISMDAARSKRTQSVFVAPHEALTAIPTEDMKVMSRKEAFPSKGNSKGRRNTFIYFKPRWQDQEDDWVTKARKVLGIKKADHYAPE